MTSLPSETTPYNSAEAPQSPRELILTMDQYMHFLVLGETAREFAELHKPTVLVMAKAAIKVVC